MLGVRGLDVLLEVGVVVERHSALVTHHVLGLQVNLGQDIYLLLDQGYCYTVVLLKVKKLLIFEYAFSFLYYHPFRENVNIKVKIKVEG